MTEPRALAGLIEAAKELQDDLLMRGERDSDGTVIVNASFGRWKRFCEALTAASSRPEPSGEPGGEAQASPKALTEAEQIVVWLQTNPPRFHEWGPTDFADAIERGDYRTPTSGQAGGDGK